MIAMRFSQLQKHLCIRHDRGTLPHAMLVYGPAGVGKQLLLDACLSRWYPTAGTRVSSCITVSPLAATDIHKTKKDISVEQIRALRDMLATGSYAGEERLVIITPAESMSAGAANSLLKVLEEPPTHTRFVLLADCVTGVPVTIRSRCELFQLLPSHTDEVRDVLLAAQVPAPIADEVVGMSFGLMGQAHVLAQDTSARATYQEQIELLFSLFGMPVYAQRPQLEQFLGDGKDHVAQRRRIADLFRRWQCAAGAYLRSLYGQPGLQSRAADAARERGVHAAHVLGFLQTLQEAQYGIVHNVHPKLLFESLMFRLYANV